MIAFIKRDFASQALYFRFLPKHSLLERVCEGSGTKEPWLAMLHFLVDSDGVRGQCFQEISVLAGKNARK